MDLPSESGLRTKLEYADLASIPPDGKRYELLDGDLHVTAAPNIAHQRTVGRLYRSLQDYFGLSAETLLAPCDVILSPRDVVEPDLIVVRDQRQISERAVEGPPFMAVEVLSPSTAHFDRTVKARFYAAHGIAHYWIVDPVERRIECYELDGSAYRLAASSLSGELLTHAAFPDLTLDRLWA